MGTLATAVLDRNGHSGTRDALPLPLTIIPWPFHAAQQNADIHTAQIHGVSAAGQPIYYCADIPSTPAVETGRVAPDALGRPVLGLGGGAPVSVRFTPGMWSPSSGVRGPGSGVDEILLHEVVHAFRAMAGRQSCVSVPNGYDTFEELIAVIVTNMHQSELRRPLRRSHQGFGFVIGESYYHSALHVEWIGRFCRQEPVLTRALSRVPYSRCRFNPFLEYY